MQQREYGMQHVDTLIVRLKKSERALPKALWSQLPVEDKVKYGGMQKPREGAFFLLASGYGATTVMRT